VTWPAGLLGLAVGMLIATVTAPVGVSGAVFLLQRGLGVGRSAWCHAAGSLVTAAAYGAVDSASAGWRFGVSPKETTTAAAHRATATHHSS